MSDEQIVETINNAGYKAHLKNGPRVAPRLMRAHPTAAGQHTTPSMKGGFTDRIIYATILGAHLPDFHVPRRSSSRTGAGSWRF